MKQTTADSIKRNDRVCTLDPSQGLGEISHIDLMGKRRWWILQLD